MLIQSYEDADFLLCGFLESGHLLAFSINDEEMAPIEVGHFNEPCLFLHTIESI